MCIANVNATLRCFDKLEVNGGNINFGQSVNTLELCSNNKGKYVDRFSLFLSFNLLPSMNAEKAAINVVNKKGTLECLVRIKKQDGDSNIYLDIEHFEVDIKNFRDINMINFDRVITINGFYLPDGCSEGVFVLELLIKRKIENFYDKVWNLQSSFLLIIKDGKA